MPTPTRSADIATWSGFLVVAFGVVGLIGAFATYAAQIPFDRAMARSDAISRTVTVLENANPSPEALRELRPLLGDSANAMLLPKTQDSGRLEARADAERARVFASFHAEALDIGFRLRFVIVAFTATAALFGCMVLSIVRGRAHLPAVLSE